MRRGTLTKKRRFTLSVEGQTITPGIFALPELPNGFRRIVQPRLIILYATANRFPHK
jgi:hypothetical protein